MICVASNHNKFCSSLFQLLFAKQALKERSEEKNAEHTRMYTILRASSSQYSRQLLSILAQQVKKQN